MIRPDIIVAFAALALTPLVGFAEWTHELGMEHQYFFSGPQDPRQGNDALSLSYTPQWNESSGNHLFDFQGFARLDFNDSERSHVDINELSWIYTHGDFEFRTGIRKVFWGVTESQHLVDIINQTDAVERVDGEVKLGQPMFNAAWNSSLGQFDVFVLPYFRERTFAGVEGRLRTGLVVDTDNPVYEDEDADTHVDYALRWKHSFDIWDFGLSYFDGTGRDPVLKPDQRSTRLIPHYVQIQQTGLDIQATLDAWLWKLEAIKREASQAYPEQQFESLAGGFEYTLFNFRDSGADIGLVAEYLYDSRGDEAVFDDYGFIGVRVALNDEQSTDFLIGCGVDRSLCALEGSRRLNDSLSLSLRANTFSNIEDDSALASQKTDDNLQINLTYYF
ncbi:MAG: hypothetical protein ACRBHB_16775 [Arenicella sp.]